MGGTAHWEIWAEFMSISKKFKHFQGEYPKIFIVHCFLLGFAPLVLYLHCFSSEKIPLIMELLNINKGCRSGAAGGCTNGPIILNNKDFH